MRELKNMLGQRLLTLEGDDVRGIGGDIVGTVRGTQLLNLQGQVLAEVSGPTVLRDGKPLLEVRGDHVVNASGQRIAVVESGDARQRGLLAVAFLCFCG